MKQFLKSQKDRVLPWLNKGQVMSIRAAAREQHLDALIDRLRAIIPNVSDQNTTYAIDTDALEWRVRALHAFQMKLVLQSIDRIWASRGQTPLQKPFVVVDVGDSAGTHLLYLNALLGSDDRFKKYGFKSLSVNLDPVAVEKIQAKGLSAELCSAEKLHEKNIHADLFVSFETLEHLSDPISFLDAMSRESRCEWFVVTVPYVRASRVGMQYIRHKQDSPTTPENTHIFELCPEDWRLLFLHSGWKIELDGIYLQYPRFSPMRLSKALWRKFDFEGFYGVLLRRDRSWADLYKR